MRVAPGLRRDGDINIHVRVDKRILAAVNQKGAFSGRIANASNIGLRSDDLVVFWNEDTQTTRSSEPSFAEATRGISAISWVVFPLCGVRIVIFDVLRMHRCRESARGLRAFKEADFVCSAVLKT